MKIYIYYYEVPNSVRVIFDYYPMQNGQKIHKEKELWVRYIL